ncbi:MAG: hypothetical protein LUF89_10570 [Ruminococcus sp.]|nr:hypothetical protein [Ruminococcus sp.]
MLHDPQRKTILKNMPHNISNILVISKAKRHPCKSRGRRQAKAAFAGGPCSETNFDSSMSSVDTPIDNH